MCTTLPTDLRIDYDVRQNGVEERMLKREKECSVRRRGSWIHSCARSETKRACVLFRKVVCYVGATPENQKILCNRILVDVDHRLLSDTPLPTVSNDHRKKRQSVYVNRNRNRLLVRLHSRLFTVVYNKDVRLTVCQAVIYVPTFPLFGSPRPVSRFSSSLTSPSCRFHALSSCWHSATRDKFHARSTLCRDSHTIVHKLTRAQLARWADSRFTFTLREKKAKPDKNWSK